MAVSLRDHPVEVSRGLKQVAKPWWEHIRSSADVMYLLLIELCKDSKHYLKRQALLRTGRDLIESYNQEQKDAKKKVVFTSQTAQTPMATYSATFTKATRNKPNKTVGKLLGMIHLKVLPLEYRVMYYTPVIRPAPWDPYISCLFRKLYQQRARLTHMKHVPKWEDHFVLTTHGVVHGYGVKSKHFIPKNTQTWIYYTGSIYTIWERPDFPEKISYRFAINGFPWLFFDPTDAHGNLTDSLRKVHIAASINEARGSQQKANCVYGFNKYARWQICIETIRDIHPGDELLVSSYGNSNLDVAD